MTAACRYLQEKDVFEKYYKQHLAKRLLSGRAVRVPHFSMLQESLPVQDCPIHAFVAFTRNAVRQVTVLA